MKIVLNNKLPVSMMVMLEPIGDSFNIPSSQTGELYFSTEDVEVDFHDESSISFWSDGDIKVVLPDGELNFPHIS